MRGMMRGDFITASGGVVLFVFAVLYVALYLNVTAVAVSTDLKGAQEKLDVVDITYFVRDCLGEGGVVDAALLGRNEGKALAGVEELSPDCRLEASAKVEDLERGDSWELGREREWSHEIFVPLRSGGEVRVGRLHVSI